jgi:hypothetical protein
MRLALGLLAVLALAAGVACHDPTDPGNALNETGLPGEADSCGILITSPIVLARGDSEPVYGGIVEFGVTDPPGPPIGVQAELGIGPYQSNPIRSADWSYAPASWWYQNVVLDEFTAQLHAPPSAGSYSYVFRFSLDNGAHWTYCDLDWAGSAPGVDFSPAKTGTLTVQ